MGSRHAWGVPTSREDRTETTGVPQPLEQSISHSLHKACPRGVSLARRGAGRLHHPLARTDLGSEAFPGSEDPPGGGRVGTGVHTRPRGEALLPAQDVHKFQRSYQTS